jgi:hypothetical protein
MGLDDIISEAAMIAIIVEDCASCPFTITSDDSAEPWLCDALGFETDGNPRKLPEQRHLPGGWPPPPDWCPLREADRLVTLRPRSKT